MRIGCLFQSTTDTEVINHLIARSNYSTVVDRLIDALGRVKGAYSLLLLTNEALIGVRDPMGVRPLVIGQLEDAWILTSESCALDIIGARFVRDVEPGEIVIVDGNGLRSIKPFAKQQRRFCVFEHIYFARPDSKVEGVGVYDARKRIGMELAKESPVAADVVVPVPDSGVPAAIGYAAQSGLPFELGIIRNHYVGRTFIEPADHIRHLGVRLKHNANRAHIEGKRVILVDDLIVRGTTSMKIVEMVRNAGAKEVHMRIAAPPTTDPCFYGIDTPDKDKLLASRYDVAGMAKFIGVDLLGLRLDQRPLSRDGPAGRPRSRRSPPSATPASPATIRSSSTTWSASRIASFPSSSNRSEFQAMTEAAVGRLAGRVALITGASRGLGAAAALAYATRRRALRAGRPHGRRPRGGRRPHQGARRLRPRWCRSTSPTVPASTGWARRCSTASAASTCCWATPASSARSRRWAISSPRCSSR